MNNELIGRIYQNRYEPICTPRNLLDNMYLDNYEYVKFENQNNGHVINAQMRCKCADGISRVFLYEFDDKDWLNRVTVIEPEFEEIFSRETELNQLMSEYQQLLNAPFLSTAV